MSLGAPNFLEGKAARPSKLSLLPTAYESPAHRFVELVIPANNLSVSFSGWAPGINKGFLSLIRPNQKEGRHEDAT